MKRTRQPIDPVMIAEMRRLRGLNNTFDEIAEILTKKGFKTSQGGPVKMNTIVYLFQKTKDMELGSLEPKSIPKSNMVDVVLRGPLESDVKLKLIDQIQKGEITDLNYTKLDVPPGGGRIFERGNYAQPAAKVAVQLASDRLKDRCKLIVHFYDEIKKIADS